ncbi:TPM domain-containing protein [Tenacibaculum sp. C7A-26P2]|uniref:TPM domain-containing protein n=1 Tax=Tenacibaculum sp. C7A-26P2 TaxID=3447504 RepID=UPI003F83F234
MKTTTFTVVFLFTFCSILNAFSQGFQIPEKPGNIQNQKGVYDYINLLTSYEKSSLEKKLIKYSDTTSTQIVVATINSTKGEDIGFLATNWAHKWGVGQEKEDNGVFILLAKKDKKITIRTGYGIEHLLTDYLSRQIIEYDMLPYFKEGNYYEGFDKGIDTVFRVLQGEYKETRKKSDLSDFDPGLIIFIIILIIFFITVFNGNKNNRGGGRGNRNSPKRNIFDTIILSNSGRGSFSKGAPSNGGGFSGGFGGGGFGGGGATGSW